MFIFLHLASCQSLVTKETDLSLDPGLIQPWTQELQDKEPCRDSSFLATYKQGGRSLYFLAMLHSMGPVEGNSNFLFVKEKLNELNPDFILIENQERQLGISPEKIKNEVNRCRVIDFVGCKENIYAASLALEKGLPFQGAEPSDEEIMRFMNQGFQRSDYYGLIWIRNVNEWKRKGGLNFKKEIPIIFAKVKERLGPEMDMSFIKFKSWYKLKTGELFDEKVITSDTIAPVKDSIRYEQQLAYKVDQIREPGIQYSIDQALKKYKTVLLIYGSGHHVKQRRALEKTFGKAEYICHL